MIIDNKKYVLLLIFIAGPPRGFGIEVILIQTLEGDKGICGVMLKILFHNLA